jgi:hypothetical protein
MRRLYRPMFREAPKFQRRVSQRQRRPRETVRQTFQNEAPPEREQVVPAAQLAPMQLERAQLDAIRGHASFRPA